MMTDYQKLIDAHKQDIKKSLIHLKYSYEKVKKLPIQIEKTDSETLETWEGFVARFARVSDLFIMKYLKTKVKLADPGFRGSVMDLLNLSEKLNLIDDARVWYRIRELRNQATNDYTEEEFEKYLEEIRHLTSTVLAVEKIL